MNELLQPKILFCDDSKYCGGASWALKQRIQADVASAKKSTKPEHMPNNPHQAVYTTMLDTGEAVRVGGRCAVLASELNR